VSTAAPLVLVREAFGAAGERRFALQRALYRTLLGADWGQLVLAFAWLKRLDDLVDENPDAGRALEILAEHRELVARVYAGEPIGDVLDGPARFAVPFLVWDRGRGSRLRSGVERLLATMEFDTCRRGRVLDAATLAAHERELGATITCSLASLVAPTDTLPAEFVAVASIAYLRADALIDLRHDLALGIINISREDLVRHAVAPDPAEPGLHAWVAEQAAVVLEHFERALALGRQLDRWSLRLLATLYLSTKRRGLRRFLAREDVVPFRPPLERPEAARTDPPASGVHG
jgi:hypothetical protein